VNTPSYPPQAEVFKTSGKRRIFNVGEFDAHGKMITGRFAHTATLMANGQVLFTGGIGESDVALDSSELFEPKEQTFRATISDRCPVTWATR